MFDYDAFNHDHPDRFMEPDFSTAETSKKTLLRLVSEVTVNERMNYTPAPQDTFAGAFLRGIEGSVLKFLDQISALGYFHIVKFVTNYFICYRYSGDLKQIMTVPHRVMAFDPISPGVEYGIQLNSTAFKNADIIQLIFSRKKGKPHGELMIPKVVERGNNTDGQQYNKFRLKYHEVHFCFLFLLINLNSTILSQKKTTNLPWPWQNCVKESKSSKIEQCLNPKLRQELGVGSPMTQFTRGDFKIVSEETLNSTAKKYVYDAIQFECDKQYTNLVECEDSVIDTKISERRIGTEFIIEAMIPDEPSEYIVNEVKITLKQLMLSLTSNFGTFFGLSLFGLCFFLWSDSSWPSNKKLNVALSTVLVALRIKKQAARNRQDIEMGEIVSIGGTNYGTELLPPPPTPSTSRADKYRPTSDTGPKGLRRQTPLKDRTKPSVTKRTEDYYNVVPDEIQIQIDQQWESIDKNEMKTDQIQVELNSKLDRMMADLSRKLKKEKVELNDKLDQLMAELSQNLESKLSDQIEATKLQTERDINSMGQRFIEELNKAVPLPSGDGTDSKSILRLNTRMDNERDYVETIFDGLEKEVDADRKDVKLKHDQMDRRVAMVEKQVIKISISKFDVFHKSIDNLQDQVKQIWKKLIKMEKQAKDQDTTVNQGVDTISDIHREYVALYETVHDLETSHDAILKMVDEMTKTMSEKKERKFNLNPFRGNQKNEATVPMATEVSNLAKKLDTLTTGMKAFKERLDEIRPQMETFESYSKVDRGLLATVFNLMRLHHVNLDMLNEITRCQPPSIGSVIYESADSSTSQGHQDSNEVVSDSELGAVGGQE